MLTVNFADSLGNEVEVSAENLRDLSNALLEAGYEEGTLTAYTDQGVAGWVNAKTYRYA